MKKAVVSWILLIVVCLPGAVTAGEYEDAVSKWTSYEDVGKWLEQNFRFDERRQEAVLKRVRDQGPAGLLVRNPASTFRDKEGYCGDAAHFSIEALNSINPEYNARWIFIKNGAGKANHWVAGFDVAGKLYVMDFGAGPHWSAMKGIHGPYDSLGEYEVFLASLSLKRFAVGEVKWRDMPGQED